MLKPCDDDGDDLVGAFFEEVERAEKEVNVGKKNDDDDDDWDDDNDSRREETFVDDDGTTYDWDEEDRKYKPRQSRGRGGEENAPAGSVGRRDARGGGRGGAAAAAAADDDEGFDVSQMTFCPEEDTLPAKRDVEKINGCNENENEKKKKKKPRLTSKP